MPSLDDVLDECEVTILGDFVFALITDTTAALDMFENLNTIDGSQNLMRWGNNSHSLPPPFRYSETSLSSSALVLCCFMLFLISSSRNTSCMNSSSVGIRKVLFLGSISRKYPLLISFATFAI